jgi:hypothetical protein
MAYEISSTTVIDNDRKLVNITGGSGVIGNFHANVDTTVTTALNFNSPVMSIVMTGATTYSESNKAAGKTVTILLDRSASLYTPTFSSNIKWKEGATPTFSSYRYWQITMTAIDSTLVRAAALGFGSTAGGSAAVSISNVFTRNLSLAGIGGTATATYRLNSTGQASRNISTNTLVDISGEWLVSGTASDFEVYATWSAQGGGDGWDGGGTIGGATPATWLNLGTLRDYTLSATNNYVNRGLTVQIRYAANSYVVDTAVIDFEVDSAP